jgi:hypothetical protein
LWACGQERQKEGCDPVTAVASVAANFIYHCIVQLIRKEKKTR